jgi:nucleoporin NUP159
VWLANDEFLLIHTPNTPEEPTRPPESVVHYVQTDKNRTVFNYQSIMDPAPPYGMNRVPPIHYFSRLRKWNHLDDMLIFASVASTDIGLITRSEVPLTREVDASSITNVYTATTFADDNRRATLPMSADGMEDTSPIGMALDLSSKDVVYNPIFNDEMEKSPFPLPAMLLLNNEGVLCGWWIILSDALRENKIYPGLNAAEGATTTAPAVASPPANPFGAPAQTSAFGGGAFAKPAAPAFGQSSMIPKPAAPAFGQSSLGAAAPAFGGASAIGQKPSIWGGSATQATGAAFGQPAFGASSFGKPTFGSPATPAPSSGGTAFGSTGGLGQKQSVWGSTPSNPTGVASNIATPFGASATGSSGFAKFGASNTTSPFGAVSGQSPFGKQTPSTQPAFAASGITAAPTPGTSFGMSTQPSFGSTVTIDSSTGGSSLGGKSVFGTPAQTGSVFGKPSLPTAASQESDMMDDDDETEASKEEKPTNAFGLGTGGFKLGSTFKPDTTSKDESDDEAPKEAPKKPLFGSDFGAAIGAAKQDPVIKKEPGTESPPPSIFGIPEKKETLFGRTPPGTGKSPFSFGLASPDPEPPQVTSKPQPSPSPATGPSSTSPSTTARSDEEDMPPLAGSPAEAVEMPESEDESEESQVEEDDAPLPPDPKSSKGSVRPSWFGEVPGAATQPSKQMPPPKASSPPPPTESPLFSAKTTTTPAGFPKAPISFAQPTPSVREFPRSPSPIRSASTPVGKPLPAQVSRPISRPSSRAAPVPAPAPPIPEPEPSFTASDLSDDEDERIREELAEEVEPSLRLGEFIAHTNYAGKVTKSGIPAQIERVYRDINSMIDTLGLNARTLTGFVKGHTELMKDEGRSKEDLDDIEFDEEEEQDDEEGEWCLVEIDDLRVVETELEKELDVSRIQDKDQKLASLRQMRKDLAKTRQKLVEVRNFFAAQKVPENKLAIKKAQLDPAQKSLQNDMRAKYAEFQKLLVEAEEGVVILRTKLATSDKKRGGRVPTVEAVENTIRKMTAMAEEKSGDVDVLEKQMRRLGMTSSDSRPTSSPRMIASLQSSTVFTPSPKRNGASSKGKTFGFEDEDDSESEDGVLVSAGDVDIDKVQRFSAVRERRRVLLRQLGQAVRKRGVITTTVPASS